YEHDYDLALKIINGMRPKVISGTPLKYKELMEQCWDANPTERHNIDHLVNEIYKMRRLYYQNESNEQQINNDIYITDYTNSSSTINSLISNFSKIHIFENLPELRNATERKNIKYEFILLCFCK